MFAKALMMEKCIGPSFPQLKLLIFINFIHLQYAFYLDHVRSSSGVYLGREKKCIFRTTGTSSSAAMNFSPLLDLLLSFDLG